MRSLVRWFAPLAAGNRPRGARADMPQRTRTVSTAYFLLILGSIRAKHVRYKNETFAGDTGALPTLRGAKAMHAARVARGRNYVRSSAARDRELRRSGLRAGCRQKYAAESPNGLYGIFFIYIGEYPR